MITAREFAIKAHGDQKYGDEPYVVHLDEVHKIVQDCSFGAYFQTVAYLHDTIEDDPNTTYWDIQREFGTNVANCVDMLTDCNNSTRTMSRKARKRMTYEKVRWMPNTGQYEPVLVVKAADRLANLRRGGKNDMYAREHDMFSLIYYRKGLVDYLWLEMDAIISGGK
jgi:(p)ppGpp synthase/HD superfamily hydrolase